jgi:hypothetical protein
MNDLQFELSLCIWLTHCCFAFRSFRFGRIGRIVCRIGIKNGLDFIAINDPFIEVNYMVNIGLCVVECKCLRS